VLVDERSNLDRELHQFGSLLLHELFVVLLLLNQASMISLELDLTLPQVLDGLLDLLFFEFKLPHFGFVVSLHL